MILNHKTKHMRLIILVSFIFLALACSPEKEKQDDNKEKLFQQGHLMPSHGAEGASTRPVSIEWGATVFGRLAIVKDALPATLINLRNTPVNVGIVAIGHSSGQAAVTVIGQYSLIANETRKLSVPLNALPLQSVGTPTQIQFVAYLNEDGVDKRIPSAGLSVAFSPDYSQAYTSGEDSFGPMLISSFKGNGRESDVSNLLGVNKKSLTSIRDELPSLKSTELLKITQHSKTRVKDPASGQYIDSPKVKTFAAGRKVVKSAISKAAESIPTIKDSKFAVPDSLDPSIFDDVPLGSVEVGPSILLPPSYAKTLRNKWIPTIRDSTSVGALKIIPIWWFFTPVKICAQYDSHFTDAARGEDYLTGGFNFPNPSQWEGPPIWVPLPIQAKYAKYYVGGYEGNLDANGCTPTLYLSSGDYSVTVVTELTRATSTYDIRELYSFGQSLTCKLSPLDRGRPECESNAVYYGTISVKGGSIFDSVQNVVITSGYDRPGFRVAAVAGQIMWLEDNGLKVNDTYKIYANSGCPPPTFNWEEACASTVAYFGNSLGAEHQDTTLEKFVIAHELGHQIQAHLVGSNSYDYTKDNTTPASCRCDHVTAANQLHCIQSRHDWSTAQTEGWAHFISQRTFNALDSNHCTFVYYKDVLDDSNKIRHPPIPVNCGQPIRWMVNHCNKAGHSTEWDILTFLRDINATTAAPGIPLKMDDIFNIYKNAPNSLTWDGFRSSALATFGNNPNNPKYKRVLTSGTTHGVSQ